MAKQRAGELELTVAEVEELLRSALRRRGYPDYDNVRFSVRTHTTPEYLNMTQTTEHRFDGVRFWSSQEELAELPLQPDPDEPTPTPADSP